MPQFDTVFFISQIFWLLVSFCGLYLGVRFIIFPMFDSIFSERKKQMDIPLDQAEKLTQKTQFLQEELERKKESFKRRCEEKLNRVYQSEVDRLQLALQQEEQNLSNRLKKNSQKAECDESLVLKNKSDFALKALKGGV